MIVPAEQLEGQVRKHLLGAGATEVNADVVTSHLVGADLRGVHSHGVSQLRGYLRAIEVGELVPDATPRVIKDSAATALVSGDWTFGQVAAEFAFALGCAKAAATGVAAVGLVEAHHTGRLGHYVEQAAGAGMASCLWAGGYGAERPLAAPYGGRQAVLGTNPLAMGMPGPDWPLVLDFATTEIAGSKVRDARRRGEQLPPGSVVDQDGNPTTDPQDLFDGGALLPFGGHKGYALMVAVELFGRALVGADAYSDTDRGGWGMRHQGVTGVVLRADLFQGMEAFLGGVGDVVGAIHDVPPAPGVDAVLVPGERAFRTAAQRRTAGVPVPDELWRWLEGPAGQGPPTAR